MTKLQTKLYWREWAAVRKARPDAPEDFRHELHRRALGGQDVSSSRLSNRQFDLVLAAFRAESRPTDVRAQIRAMRQPRVRLMFKLTQELVPDLTGLVPDPEQYVLSIMRDKFGTDDIDRLTPLDTAVGQAAQAVHICPEDERPTEPTSPSQLEQLIMTITARIRALRRSGAHVPILSPDSVAEPETVHA